MRKLIYLVLIALIFSMCNKKNDETDFPIEISLVLVDLTKSFDTLNADMSSATAFVAENISDTVAIRAKMLELFNQSSFVLEFAFVTPQGIMQIIEPSVYYPQQGSDISQQDHIIQVFQSKAPVMSKSFDAVEGFNAAVVVHPVLKNAQVLGAITALFLPETILERTILPYVTGQAFEIWVMEAGGRVLYDQDADEIGLNVITDPLYAGFPELIAAAQLIDAQSSGETTYSFFQTGTNTTVTKKAYWHTWAMPGTAWKVIWVKPV